LEDYFLDCGINLGCFTIESDFLAVDFWIFVGTVFLSMLFVVVDVETFLIIGKE
jgi:hypothetical protein